MADDFTQDGYRRLLRALLERGYTAVGYDVAKPAKKLLILRHDLDVSLQAAEPIAEIERELGLRANYFVLLRTEMYNPFSAAARASLAYIRAQGHEIGLHLDASLYGNELAVLDEAAGTECRALEAATGASVRFISFHRPAKALYGYDGPLAGRRHAYEPLFFEAMGYCSDSRGAWHHGHPLAHEAVKAGRALQLLTHPIWWQEAGDEPDVRLRRFLDDRMDFLDEELARQCGTHVSARHEKEKG